VHSLAWTVVRVVVSSWGTGGVHGSVDARFLYDGLYHTMLIHVVVKLLVSRDLDAYEFLVSSISNLISMRVEYLDDIVPLVKVLLGAEPASLCAMMIIGFFEAVHLKKSLRSHGVVLYPASARHLSNSMEKFWPAGGNRIDCLWPV
jgi:hypothetical protein